MSGMYPDNRDIEIFGEQVRWPGVGADGKFTNGDFSDPLVKPSFIPAESVNLILDNLTELIASLGGNPNNSETGQLKDAVVAALALKADLANPTFTGNPQIPAKSNVIEASAAPDESRQTAIATEAQIATSLDALIALLMDKIFHVGKLVVQYPGSPTPAEDGYPGTWEVWSNRAEMYGLVSSLPSYTAYSKGGNFSANAYVLYQPVKGDKRLLRARRAVTNAPEQYDPIDWIVAGESNFGVTIEYVPRRLVQSSWTAADLGINASADGKRVAEVITLGGKFLSVEGLNRPTFITGGVMGDRIRNITGRLGLVHGHFFNLEVEKRITDGAFSLSRQSSTGAAGNIVMGFTEAPFSTSNVVPTGSQNSPETITIRYLRRVA